MPRISKRSFCSRRCCRSRSTANRGSWIERRELRGVDFVISDDHAGLVEAINKQFIGASRQRCQVHLMRNMLGHCPSRERAAVAAAAKLILSSTDVVEARRHRDEFVKRFGKTAPKTVACLEDGFDDAMAEISPAPAHDEHD